MSEKEAGSSTKITPWLIVGIVGVLFSCACAFCSLIGFLLWSYGDLLIDGGIYFQILPPIFGG